MNNCAFDLKKRKNDEEEQKQTNKHSKLKTNKMNSSFIHSFIWIDVK